MFSIISDFRGFVDSTYSITFHIEKHLESQSEFWAREVEWAVSVLTQENRPISRSRIMKMTNMRPNDLECCCPHIKNLEIKELVQSLLNE